MIINELIWHLTKNGTDIISQQYLVFLDDHPPKKYRVILVNFRGILDQVLSTCQGH